MTINCFVLEWLFLEWSKRHSGCYMPLNAKIDVSIKIARSRKNETCLFVVQIIIHILMNGFFSIAAELPQAGYAWGNFQSFFVNFVILFTIKGISGLGPTKDISPLKILKICGISSRLVFLKNLPTLVIRGSSWSIGFTA